jgi:hypothetical protein
VTQFENKSFSVAMHLTDKGRANYERIFGKKPARPRPKKKAAK